MQSDDRSRALSVLEGLLAEAVAGRGRTATVAGTVGTGKSMLLDTFATRVIDNGALAVVGYGSPAERYLPLGLMNQLLRAAPLPLSTRERTSRLCSEVARACPAGRPGSGPVPLDVPVMHEIGTIMLDLSERYPLAIVVDDAHHADEASLWCLVYLCRRARNANMLIVMSHSELDPLQDDVVSLPQHTRLRLAPFTPEAVGAVVTARIGAAAGRRYSAEWHRLTGGNPLLLDGLIEDYVTASDHAAGGEVAGIGYGRAVLRAVSSGGSDLRKVAQALALSSDPRLARPLYHLDPAAADRLLRSLTGAGILDQGVFRHQAARDAVLADMDGAGQADLHRRAAHLAHEWGAGAAVIAEHLRQAPPVDTPWATRALEDAARTALRDGDVDRGLKLLECVRRQSADPVRRNGVTTELLRARWRVSPAMASDLVGGLLAGHERGELRAADAAVLTRALLWQGRCDEARTVLKSLPQAADGSPGAVPEVAVLQPWLRATYPALRDAAVPPAAGSAALMSTVSSSRRLKAVTLLCRVLERGAPGEVVAVAERILRSVNLDETTLDTVESALLALVYGGHADVALPWCDKFVEEAARRGAPSRQARLLSIRAETALRLGDLRGARDHARTALELMPRGSWGAAIGAPLASLIMAGTAMGEFGEVQAYVDEPVPEGMFQSRAGLLYLQARGHYSLAAGHPKLALRDFTRCGDLMAEWRIDTAGLVAWRNDIAETCLALDRTEQATKLIEEQLARSGGQTRVQGVAMRLLAATGALRHRPMLLRQSGDLLQRSGDRYELARTLTMLTEAHEALGESRRAAMISRRARDLAQECHIPLGETESGDTQAAAGADSPAKLLSDAERRVASLAAVGYTNREISDKLFVTLSTVEQHLTRIYRKLNVSNRSDLPPSLDMNRAATA